jgi:hypothetical protein
VTRPPAGRSSAPLLPRHIRPSDAENRPRRAHSFEPMQLFRLERAWAPKIADQIIRKNHAPPKQYRNSDRSPLRIPGFEKHTPLL